MVAAARLNGRARVGGAETADGDIEVVSQQGLLACWRVDLDHSQLDARSTQAIVPPAPHHTGPSAAPVSGK